MANKRRLAGYSGFRLDLPHVRLIESAVTGDFDDVLRGVITGLSSPYIVRGFNVVGATADINVNVRGMRLRVGDAAILHPTATEAGTMMLVPQSEPDFQLDTTNTRVIGDWVPGVNYVALDYRRNIDEDTVDQTAGWSQSEKTELQKAVPIGYTMDFRVIISTTGFGNYLPLYTVEINNSEQIVAISNAKPHLFRLATGGAVPNPANNYNWATGGTPASRIEGPMTMSGSTSLSTAGNPWGRGDWGIENLKQMFDAFATRFKEITGSPFWYADGSFTGGPLNLLKTWWDANGSVMTSGGSFSLDIAADINYTPTVYQRTQPALEAVINSVSPDWNIRVRATNAASTFTVTTRASLGTGRTLTTSAPHGRPPGDRIVVAGVGDNYDGIFVLSAASGTTLEYLGESLFTEGAIASSGTISQVQGRGEAKNLNGSILRLSRVTGAFSPNDTLEFRLSQNSATINRSGTVATIDIADTSVYGPTGAPGDEFIGSISGASDPNLNLSEGIITIVNATQLSYVVQNIGSVSESGSFVVDGVLATPSINSSAGSVTIGPLAWDQDIFIRGVIGGRQYRLTQDAVAVGVGAGTSTAAIYGPGTVNIAEEGQVAYLLLHRDLPLGAGTFNISSSVVSPSPIGQIYVGSDGSNQTVLPGDYVKIDSDTEDKWYQVNASGQLLDPQGAVVSPSVNATGVRLLVSKGTYSTIFVARRQNVPASSDVYWMGYREDRGSVPVVYLRSMELEAGEERQVNDNTATNLLIYTGAMTESATEPSYQFSAPASAWEYESEVEVLNKEVGQNVVYLTSAPQYGIQQGDLLVDGSNVYTVAYPLDASSFVVKESLSALTIGAGKIYRRPNTAVLGEDNLTRGIRKIDRLLARFSTILNRPVYDESVYIQKVNLSPDAGAQNETLRSGYWITTAGGGLAWVLAASNTSSANWPQEVKNPLTGSVVADSLLLHVITNPGGAQFNDGATLLQSIPNATSATRTIAVGGGLQQTALWGDASGVTGQTIKLPPNTRTGLGTNGSSSPTGGSIQPYAAYNAKTGKGGGELLLIANDSTRECGVDFLEDDASQGPARFPGLGVFITNAAQVQLTRGMPVDSRLRFRNLATFGLPPIVSPATFTLQTAYDGPGGGGSASGRIINTVTGLPVEFNNSNPTEIVQKIGGRLAIATTAGSGIQPDADLGSSVGFNNFRFAEIWTAEQNISSFPAGQFPGAESKTRTAGLQTSGAALSTMFALPLQDGRSYRIKAKIVARRTDVPSSGFASFVVEALVYRDGGAAILASPPVTTIVGNSLGASAYAATIDVSGNNVRVRVGGDTGHLAAWVSTIEFQSVSDGV